MAVAVFGLREFQSNLLRLGAEAQDLKDVFAQIALEVQQDARSFAPARTGKLRSKIRGSKASRNRARITVTGTRYHRFVHFGSIHNVANPFMFKAADANANTVEQRLLDGMNKLIARTF